VFSFHEDVALFSFLLACRCIWFFPTAVVTVATAVVLFCSVARVPATGRRT